VVYWFDGYQQAPVCIPLHNALIPDDQKANYVYWSEHLNFRDTIDRSGNREIRNLKDGKLLQVRIEEADGVIRTKTPSTEVIQKDSDGSIAAKCTGNLIADAGGNLSAKAKGKVDVDAGGTLTATAKGNATLKAPVITLDGEVICTKNVAVIGNVAATGTIIDTGGNTNHHSHG